MATNKNVFFCFKHTTVIQSEKLINTTCEWSFSPVNAKEGDIYRVTTELNGSQFVNELPKVH